VPVDPEPNPVPDEVWAALPRKRLGAGVVLLDGAGRVLLVEPTYKPGWETPGGMVEANESPRAAAARECQEEIGVGSRSAGFLSSTGCPPADARTTG
jgi:8-oxo-dGTP pyrophosphatase MutT (NUDIX family)